MQEVRPDRQGLLSSLLPSDPMRLIPPAKRRPWQVLGLLTLVTVLLLGWRLQGVMTNPALADGIPGTTPVVAGTTPPVDANRIQVGISDDSMTRYEYPSATLASQGDFRIWEPATRQLLWRGMPGWQVKVSVDAAGFYLWPQHGPSSGERLGPFTGPLFAESMQVGRFLQLPDIRRKGVIPTYRGLLWFKRGSSSPQRLTVVNDLDLQDYLRAVVPNELPIRFGLQAVKAQAVAARNYALRPRDKVWPQFDICDSQYCQAYYGQHTETPQTDAALAETNGLLALYDGEPILALYSSTNGGHSEDYGNVFADPKTLRFPIATPPYLQGRPDNPEWLQLYGDLSQEGAARQFWGTPQSVGYDQKSPLGRWQRTFLRAQLEASLGRNLDQLARDPLTRNAITPAWEPGQPFGTLTGLTITQRGRSGKAMRLQINSTTGSWLVSREFTIRKVLASMEGKALPSASFVINYQPLSATAPESWTLLGGGFGHGVGMSQYGASYLGNIGVQWPGILQHYYQGVSIGSIPLTASPSQAEMTHFHGAQSLASLYVKTAQGFRHPLTVRFNGETLTVPPSPEGRVRLELSRLLKVGQRNELVVLPYPEAASAPTVWVELVPPRVAYSPPGRPTQVVRR